VHLDTGDRWSGPLCADAPVGQGEYVYADSQLRVTACISGEAAAALVFSGEACQMAWPDGSSYSGTLVESAFHGQGTFTWANRDVYCGEWRQAKRHGMGDFTSYQGALDLPAGERAYSAFSSGGWADDEMHGQGCIEFFAREHGSGGRESLRRFQGQFRNGFPTQGSLQAGQEYFDKVQFDGHTPAGGFAVWYWSGDALSESRGTSMVDLHRGSEEFQAALAQFSDSSLMSSLTIKSIQRVQNDERRLIYDLQRRALEKKVTAPPRSMRWNPRTMERWAFHAPGCGRGRVGEDASGAALPWECIVEEGFHASLAGSENGSVYGAGIYFAKDAALSHQYAQKTAYMAASRQGHASGHASGKECRVFLTRIATGMYTAGHNGMNQPPIDAAGAKGEHFHSLVDNPHNPRIFVVNDNTRAYPAYLVTYESSTSSHGYRWPGAVQRHPVPWVVPAAGAHHAGNAVAVAALKPPAPSKAPNRRSRTLVQAASAAASAAAAATAAAGAAYGGKRKRGVEGGGGDGSAPTRKRPERKLPVASGKRKLSEEQSSAKMSSSSSPPRPIKRHDPSILVIDLCSDSE